MDATPAAVNKCDAQKCAICLEDLFSAGGSKVGAVVPCGHCLHTGCFRQWEGAAYNRRISRSNNFSPRTVKCPICNVPADTFVPLFLDTGSAACATAATPDERCTTPTTIDGTSNDTSIDTEVVDNTTLDATLDASTDGQRPRSPEPQNQNHSVDELLANQERTKAKLKRYKRQNKSLKQELMKERHDMEEMLVSTIQNFYKIMEKHEAERRKWTRGALDLRKELDDTLEEKLQEQRVFNRRKKMMQQELDALKGDCQRANQQVLSASEGLAELKLHHAKRQSKLHVVLQDKAKLMHENRRLKKAVLNAQGSVRSERLW